MTPAGRGVRAAVVAGTALVIVAVVVLVLVVGGGGPPAPAATLAGTAARALEKAPAVRYTGHLQTATGLLDVDLFADRDGELVGTLAFPAGGTAKLLALHGGIYLDGDRAWWLTADPAKTGLPAGRRADLRRAGRPGADRAVRRAGGHRQVRLPADRAGRRGQPPHAVAGRAGRGGPAGPGRFLQRGGGRLAGAVRHGLPGRRDRPGRPAHRGGPGPRPRHRRGHPGRPADTSFTPKDFG